MRGNHSPRALHHELHQKAAQSKHGDGMRVSPQGNHGNREKRGYHNRAAPANPLGPCSEQNPAQQRPYISHHRDEHYRLRLEVMPLGEKCRIQILGAVAKGIKGKH